MQIDDETPLLPMWIYLFRYIEPCPCRHLFLEFKSLSLLSDDLRERQSQVGSLAGAAHLLNDNTGVLRGAQWEQKSHVEQKGKSSFDFDFQYEYKLWKHGLSIL
jgi:hypothetical protein